MQKILLVEDEKNLAFNLQLNLKAEGFDVVYADNGEQALKSFQEKGPFSLIILDVMIPELNGFEVAQSIRKKDNRVGILMLTARASDEDRLQGLSLGADDYLCKPFHLGELLLRIRRMAERSSLLSQPTRSAADETLHFRAGPLHLDMENLRLSGPAGEHQLTSLEADILKEFILHHGRTLTRSYLLDKVWGLSGNIETRTVDNFILRLRKLIEQDPARPGFLLSIRGKGYKLFCEEHAGHHQSPGTERKEAEAET
ncbi:MAG: response regulator transcription factor [Deltaproteobacteria bacterium]|nr:response regulator transcription factor [Deltaproteobacteria bacterium]